MKGFCSLLTLTILLSRVELVAELNTVAVAVLEVTELAQERLVAAQAQKQFLAEPLQLLIR
jgi:hypothetical protein